VEERFPGRLALLKVKALAGAKGIDYEELCESLRRAIGLRRS
jgi:hypothetical protein